MSYNELFSVSSSSFDPTETSELDGMILSDLMEEPLTQVYRIYRYVLLVSQLEGLDTTTTFIL